jgi:release factor glutamine methyltransferase
VISNPPYIPSKNFKDLPRSVKDFEPKIALDGGQKGIEVYKRILSKVHKFLKPDSIILLEIFDNQVRALKRNSLMPAKAEFVIIPSR